MFQTFEMESTQRAEKKDGVKMRKREIELTKSSSAFCRHLHHLSHLSFVFICVFCSFIFPFFLRVFTQRARLRVC